MSDDLDETAVIAACDAIGTCIPPSMVEDAIRAYLDALARVQAQEARHDR